MLIWLKEIMVWACMAFVILGLIGIFWPLPLFLLPSNWADYYLKLLVDIEKDKSAGSALPFFWAFVTLPIGMLSVIISLSVYFLVKKFL